MTMHARLSPSGAKRWMNCPASPRLIAASPEQESGPAAREGTAAHSLAALCLTNGEYDALDYIGHVFADTPEFPVTEKMGKAVNWYLNHVYGLMQDYANSELFVERRFSLAHIHPDMGGTADAVIWVPDTRTLHVCDYKNGRGIVDGIDNPQLKSYAVGALAIVKALGHKPRNIITHVVQPLAGVHPITSAEFSPLDLAEFVAELMEAGARCDDPNAAPCAGDWCTFCPAAATCPALVDAVRDDFNAAAAYTSGLDSDSSLGEMLAESRAALKRVKTWNDAVEERAFNEACAGNMPEGFKAVAGAGRRQWINHGDEAAFMNSVAVLAGADKRELWTAVYKSPPQLEKELAKPVFAKLANLIEIKQGAPKLVPVSAKGEAVSLSNTSGFEVVKD